MNLQRGQKQGLQRARDTFFPRKSKFARQISLERRYTHFSLKWNTPFGKWKEGHLNISDRSVGVLLARGMKVQMQFVVREKKFSSHRHTRPTQRQMKLSRKKVRSEMCSMNRINNMQSRRQQIKKKQKGKTHTHIHNSDLTGSEGGRKRRSKIKSKTAQTNTCWGSFVKEERFFEPNLDSEPVYGWRKCYARWREGAK